MVTSSLNVSQGARLRFAPRSMGSSSNLLSVLFPIGFFLFMCGVSRIGLSFMPAATEVFWVSGYACLLWFAARKPTTYIALARRNIPFLFAAAFAICSSLWSITPSISAYSGTLLFLNVLMGFVVAERLGLKRFIVLIFAFAFGVQIASMGLVAIHHPSAFNDAGEAKGLYLHKNALSMHACLLYLTSIILFAAGWRRWLSAAGIVLALTSLLLSRSGTGMLMVVLISGIFGICLLTARGRQVPPFIAGIVLACFCAAIAVVSLSSFDIVGGVLNSLGKDSTLTGRTVLWDEAIRLFEERPWLGLGYNSYWNSPECASLSINVGGWLGSFHNIYLDRLVDVGAVGLSFFLIALANVIRTSWMKFQKDRTAISAWPFVYTCFIAALGLSEFPIFWNGEFQLLLSFSAAVTCGVRLQERKEHEASLR
jgi:exopolysaccharide production protein ExoQ